MRGLEKGWGYRSMVECVPVHTGFHPQHHKTSEKQETKLNSTKMGEAPCAIPRSISSNDLLKRLYSLGFHFLFCKTGEAYPGSL